MADKKELDSEYNKNIMAVHDTMHVLNGKWKISILSTLCYYEIRRFSDVLNDLKKISNKQLSRELKDLEANKLIKRTILDTQPITVMYELTEYGKTLHKVIQVLCDWGFEHRKEITEK